MANQPQFPIYIISKGRAYNPITAKNLIAAGIDFKIVVEPQEQNEYEEAVGSQYVLVLPFSNLGLGSFPARNFCWEHARARNYLYHWILDDNIQYWSIWKDGKRTKLLHSQIAKAFTYVEREVLSQNADIGGFEEPNFVTKPPRRPFKSNCHIYSIMLIRNDLPYRWRLKYNEDVDLCLQVLHNGGKTISCVYFMADKVSTANKMPGGNQTELYGNNDPKKKLLKAKMLEAVWPQYAKTVIRFNRFHHFVDWKVFKKQGRNSDEKATS